MVTKIKIFDEELHMSHSAVDIEKTVNDFIKDKEVVNTHSINLKNNHISNIPNFLILIFYNEK